MHSTRLARMILAGLVFLLADTGAGAPPPKSPFRFDLIPLVDRPRSQAPQTFDVVLENRLEGLIQGELELSIYVGRKMVQKYRSDPLALTAEQQRFRLTLPPITVHHEETPVTAVAKFVSDQGTFEPDGDRDVVVATYWKRWFVVAISRPPEQLHNRDLTNPVGRWTRPRDSLTLEMALSLERFNPNTADRTDITTFPMEIAPTDFPATTMGYTGFDVVLAEGYGFTQLRDAQLAALGDWVEAGGSVLIRPTGVLRSQHLTFLNRLIAGRNDLAPLALDARGHLTGEAAPAEGGQLRLRFGMGRAVIVGERGHAEDFADREWLETSLFLLKVRQSEANTIRRSGFWGYSPTADLTNTTMAFTPRGGVNEIPRSYAPLQGGLESLLKKLMIPAQVQTLPFGVVVTILVLFLLAIAPGDYFFLGALRARRYTWLLLAVLSLLFTFGTMRIAEAIMGHFDHHRSIAFVDIGFGDRPARTSRFDLLFTATQKTIESTFRDALFVPIDSRISGLSKEKYSAGFYVESIIRNEEQEAPAGSGADLPELGGKPPAGYTVRRQTRQWSPLLSRTTALGDRSAEMELTVPGFPWTKLDPISSPGAAVAEIRRIEPAAQVLLFHGRKFVDLGSTNDPEEAVRGLLSQQPTHMNRSLAGSTLPGAPQVDPFEQLLLTSCIGDDWGMFAVLSQMAPAGGAGLEDLVLLDPTDPRDWLLVVLVTRDTERMVIRKSYRGGP